MKNHFVLALLLSGLGGLAQASDFQSLFNGKDLSGWEGHAHFWSVKEGAIHGQTTAENPTKGNTFLIWKGGDLKDFEFRAQVRFRGNNSGVQYRSEVVDPANFVLRGYQADLHPKQEYFGMLYGEKLKPRGIIAQRGQRVEIGADGKSKVVKKVGDASQLTDWAWNEIRVVTAGDHLLHQINGVTTVLVTDRHPDALSHGRLGLQLHAGAPMTVEFKNLRLRKMERQEAEVAIAVALSTAPKTAAATKATPKPEAKPTKPVSPSKKPQPKKPETKTPPKSSAAKPAPAKTASMPPKKTTSAKPAPAKAAPTSPKKPATAAAPPSKAQPAPKPNRHWVAESPAPQWIWSSDPGNLQHFRKKFLVPFPVKKARIYAVVDDRLTLWVNQKLVGESSSWQHPFERDVTDLIQSGLNTLAVRGFDTGGAAGMLLKLELTDDKGAKSYILSDQGWRVGAEIARWTSTGFDDAKWKTAAIVAKAGDEPWGIPSASSAKAAASPNQSAQDGKITVPKGFRVEKIYDVPKDTQGSWVALTRDNQGRLLASDQGKAGLFRITPGKPVKVEKMPVAVSGAQGLVAAFGGVYFNKNGGLLHRIEDSNNDGLWDTAYELPSSRGGGEHGNHAVIVTNDGKALYVVGGNHTDLPELAKSRVPTWDEDLLLPRQWDARGHARGRLAPGGWVTRFDPEAKTHELISIGYRNQYDVALNQAGDLFTYDADMEWDLGLPWYRPTRICLVASGSDFGWRSGSGKWPTYYEDSLPPVADIGPGSPTGVVFRNRNTLPHSLPGCSFRPGLDLRNHLCGASAAPGSGIHRNS